MRHTEHGGDERTGRNRLPGQLGVPGGHPDRVEDGRAQAHRLLDDCAQVLLRAGGEVGDELVALVRELTEEVQRPGERRGGGLVAGDDEALEFVPQFDVGEPRAGGTSRWHAGFGQRGILIAGRQQDGQHILLVPRVRVGAPQPDLLGQQVVDLLASPLQQSARREPTEVALEERRQEDQRRDARVHQSVEGVPVEVPTFGALDAENDPQDDVERQLLRPRTHCDRTPVCNESGQLLFGELADDGRPLGDLRAVERRHEQLAIAGVLRRRRQDQRVPSDDGLDECGGIAGLEQLVVRQDLTVGRGVRRTDDAARMVEDAQRVDGSDLVARPREFADRVALDLERRDQPGSVQCRRELLGVPLGVRQRADPRLDLRRRIHRTRAHASRV